MKTGDLAGIAIIAYITLLILALFGWMLNILQIFHFGAFATWGGIEILKIVGVFVAPVGSILGWVWFL